MTQPTPPRRRGSAWATEAAGGFHHHHWHGYCRCSRALTGKSPCRAGRMGVCLPRQRTKTSTRSGTTQTRRICLVVEAPKPQPGGRRSRTRGACRHARERRGMVHTTSYEPDAYAVFASLGVAAARPAGRPANYPSRRRGGRRSTRRDRLRSAARLSSNLEWSIPTPAPGNGGATPVLVGSHVVRLQRRSSRASARSRQGQGDASAGPPEGDPSSSLTPADRVALVTCPPGAWRRRLAALVGKPRCHAIIAACLTPAGLRRTAAARIVGACFRRGGPRLPGIDARRLLQNRQQVPDPRTPKAPPQDQCVLL